MICYMIGYSSSQSEARTARPKVCHTNLPSCAAEKCDLLGLKQFCEECLSVWNEYL